MNKTEKTDLKIVKKQSMRFFSDFSSTQKIAPQRKKQHFSLSTALTIIAFKEFR